jgi:hypothetical protein
MVDKRMTTIRKARLSHHARGTLPIFALLDKALVAIVSRRNPPKSAL